MKHCCLLLALVLTGCATITAESVQSVHVITEPPGASCQLANAAGSWKIGSTPGKARVTRDYSPLHITCTKDKTSAETMLEAHTRGRAYGNIAMGGVPALVDAHTGAGYEYRPNRAELTLK